MKIDDFKVGQIYKMSVTSRSHVAEPYYVEVTEVGPDFIVTSIPHKHSLKISYDNNWDYQTGRMTLIGLKSDYRLLLFNQNLKHVR